MSSFKLADHLHTGRRVVEIWEGNEFLAAIYSHERGFRVISKYAQTVHHERTPPGVVSVQFADEAEVT